MDPFIHTVVLIMVYLVLAFFVRKVNLKWADDVLNWPTYIFQKSNFLSIVFELIYAYYFIRVVRFIIRKLRHSVRFLLIKDAREGSLVRLRNLPGNVLKVIKKIGRWIANLPVNIWEGIKRFGRWIISLPGKTWGLIKGIGRWIASLPIKIWGAFRRLPRFFSGELAGLGKEFLEMIRNFYRLRTTPGRRISLVLSLILFLVC
ncbi:MAG: hypothetical protein NT092_07575, partial [Bacteroidia bacterium]|nr:hypothetical protein [Bacteroidia bacterium]